MKKAETMSKIGSWSFILGLVICILAGVVITTTPWLVLVLGLLGLVVGFLNVTAKESAPFLIASVALLLASGNFSVVLKSLALPLVTGAIETILGNIIVFVAPAAVLVALRTIYSLASSE
jgi:hypothetical protein